MDNYERFWIGSLHKNIQLMLDVLKAPFLVLHFSYYTSMTFLMMLSLLLLSMLITQLSILRLIKHDMWQQLELASNLLIWSTRHCGLGQQVVPWFQCWKNSLGFFDQSNNTGAIDDPSQMKMTKQALLTRVFLITNFYVLKLWLTLIKKFGGGILIEN